MAGRANIMLVDDDERLLETLSLILKWRGYNVDTASDGASAVEKCLRNHYDVTLMDSRMPRMSGMETLRRIREVDSGTKVILMTSGYDDGEVRSALAEGAYQAINKPVDITELIEILRGTVTSRPVLVVQGQC